MNYKRILSGMIALSIATSFSYPIGVMNRASVQKDVTVSAVEKLKYGVLTYEVQNNGVIITDCSEDAEAVEIPKEIDGIPVVEINSSAFGYCSKLIEIKIPESVTSIGDSAFYGCRSLIEITIPERVTNIGDSTFSGCSNLTEITIPESVTSIGNSAFSGCSSLTEITIPGSVTSIGDSAFYGCSRLIEITLLGSVTSIGDSTFNGCGRLIEITIPKSVTSIGGSAFYGCSSLTEITIPESVTSIGNYAFRGCKSLTEITIPKSVTSIGGGVFISCSNITEITLPESVTNIGDSMFSGCSNLTEITIPKNVTSIGEHAFNGCKSLTEITIPESVTSIGVGAFSSCKSLTEITIPKSVTSIEDNAFSGCSSLIKITLPESVKIIGNKAFERCSSLIEITILNKKASILTLGKTALETIYGYSGSTAQKYAELNGHNFIAIDESGQPGEVPTTEPSIPIKVPSNDKEKQEIIKKLPDIVSCAAFGNDFDLSGLKITVDYYEDDVLKSGLDVSEFIKVADGVTPESLYDKKHFVYDVPLAFDRSMIAEDGTVVIDGKKFYALDIADAFDGVTVKFCIGARGDITLDHTVDARDIALISEEYNEMMMNDNSVLLDELKKREFPSDLAESFSDKEIADFAARLGNAKNKPETALDAVDMAYITYFCNEIMLAEDGEFDEYEYWRDFDASK